MENYDLNALYLYNDDWQYRISKIAKVNDKSIRMQSGRRFLKEEFEDIYKLTDEEVKTYKGELIKKFSKSAAQIKKLMDLICSLKMALSYSDLVTVDSEKLKEQLTILENTLSEELPGILNFNNKNFKFNNCSEIYLDTIK